MTTPHDVELEIRRLSRLIEAKADELPKLLEAAGQAEVAVKVARAKALLGSQLKTVAEREAEAEVATERLALERRSREAVADACRESLRATRDVLTAVCSVGATLRAEMQLSGLPAARNDSGRFGGIP